MSGHKVVAVLDAFKEGYIYGGTVYRRKQSVLNGAKRPNYTVTPQQGTTAASSSSPQQASSSLTVVDLVLSHRGAFKLRSKVAPPKTSIIQKSSATANKAVAEGGAGASRRKKFSQRSAASGADGKGQHEQEDDEDDSDFDPLDADAMMSAAANGEDIQRLYAQIRAKREARRRAKEEGGVSSSTSSSNTSRPEVVWRQEHCFVRAVTPLLGQSAEDEEDRYRRKEEEAEEERLREEEADAKLTLEHALQASSGSPLSGSRAALMPERRRQKYENADAAAEAEREKMSATMVKKRKMTPAELANDPAMPDRELYGFTVHYFAIGKDPKKLPETTEVGKDYTKAVATALEKAGSGSVPTIRHRTYVCGTLYEQQEWLMVYRNTLLNYWHERLESSIIMAPEIFQFQCFGMSVSPSTAAPSSSFLASPQFPTGRGGAIHLVLSTTSLYLLPRSNKAEFEGDDASRFVRIPAEALASITISKSKGTVTLVGGPFSAKAPFRVAFFSPPECSEFVVEFQRIWEMSSPSAAGAESSFPYTLEA